MKGIESTSFSSSETSTNDSSNAEIVQLDEIVQIKEDDSKKTRPFVIRKNDYSNYNAYELKSWLGSGGFGRVYSAVRVTDELPVAIKYVNVICSVELLKSSNFIIFLFPFLTMKYEAMEGGRLGRGKAITLNPLMHTECQAERTLEFHRVIRSIF